MSQSQDRVQRAQRSTQRMNQALSAERAFGVGILLYSFLAIPFWANTEMLYAIRISGALLAVATVPPAWVGVQSGRWSKSLAVAAILFFVQVGWFGFQLLPGFYQVGPPLLRDGLTILAVGAVVVFLMGHSRIVGSAQASILVLLSVLGLLGVSAIRQNRIGSAAMEVPLDVSTDAKEHYADNEEPLPAPDMQLLEWSYPISDIDEDLEYRYQPYSAIKTYLPTPGLEETPLDREPDTESLDLRTWRLNLSEGGEASMRAPEQRTGPLRVDIQSVTVGKPWCVGLASSAVVDAGQSHTVVLRVRSDRVREAIVVVDSLDKKSPHSLGTLAKSNATLGTDWVDLCIPFQVPAEVERILLQFQFGSEIGNVEIASAAVCRSRDEDAGRLDMRGWLWSTYPPTPCRVVETWIDRVVLDVQTTSREPTSARLVHPGLTLDAGQSYWVDFKARAATPSRVWIEFGHSSAPWKSISEQDWCDVSTEWSGYRVELLANNSSDDACLEFLLGKAQGQVEIADVVVHPIGTTEPTEEKIRYRLSPWRYSMLHRTNKYGYRDRDHTVERPDGVFRIAFIGDSLTFGQSVPVDLRCSSLIEMELNERSRGAPRFEAINFGVCGYSTWQERLCYELDARDFSPQLVIVLMHPNDVRSANEDKEFAEQQQKNSGGVFALPGRLWDAATGGPNYQVCADELVKLADLCKSDGAKLAVFPFRTDNNSPWDGLKSAIEPALSQASVAYRDLGLDILKERNWQQLIVHRLDYHPNATAHRLAADAIVDFLIAQELVPIEPRKNPH